MLTSRGISRAKLLAGIGATAVAGRPLASRAADAYTMRLSCPQPLNGFETISALRFAVAVNRRTNGQLKIEVYPNGQLAKEQESLDGLVTGVIDLAMQSSAVLVPLFPRFQVFDMPFMFKNGAAGFRVLDGPIGNELFAELETRGIVGLGFGTGGFKQIQTTTKSITVPDDLKGLRIRIQSGAIQAATYQALGAIPVPVDISETLVALTQHTVDGADFSIDTITNGKYYAVVKRVAMTNHIFTVLPMLGSKKKIDALPAPLAKILREEAKAVIPFWRAAIAKQTEDDVDILKKAGVTFSEIQYPSFRRVMDPVYAAFQSRLGDLIDRIGRAAVA